MHLLIVNFFYYRVMESVKMVTKRTAVPKSATESVSLDKMVFTNTQMEQQKPCQMVIHPQNPLETEHTRRTELKIKHFEYLVVRIKNWLLITFLDFRIVILFYCIGE